MRGVKHEKDGTYVEHLLCDICRTEMEINKTISIKPPKFEYVCPKCGHITETKYNFPRIIDKD